MNNELADDDRFCVDGTTEDGTLQGDGERAPFFVFSPPLQRNVAGPYPTRQIAEVAVETLERGEIAYPCLER